MFNKLIEIFLRVVRGLHRDTDDLFRLLIGFEYGELLNGVGELALDATDCFPDIGSGPIDIHVGSKFDPDARVVFLAGGVDLENPGDAGGGSFEQPGDLGIHRLRRRTGQKRTHRDDRAINVGELADLDGEQRGQAADRHQQIHDQNEPRSSHAQRGQSPSREEAFFSHWSCRD